MKVSALKTPFLGSYYKDYNIKIDNKTDNKIIEKDKKNVSAFQNLSNLPSKADLVKRYFPKTRSKAKDLEVENLFNPFSDFGSTPLTPSKKRFFMTLESRTPLRDARFEDFLNGKEEIPFETFFVNLKHYRKDKLWALDMQNLTYFISDLMSDGTDFDDILSASILGVNYINGGDFGYKRAQMSWGFFPVNYTVTRHSRGEEYLKKYDCIMEKSFRPRPMEEFLGKTNCVRIERDCGDFFVFYPELFDDHSNLDLVKKVYQDLKSKENPTRKEIVDAMAKIQWLIAQEIPFQRGSDSIATLLTRSVAHSYAIPISPLKEGISLDFEAWGSDMEEYVENYSKFFEVNPLEELLSNS